MRALNLGSYLGIPVKVHSSFGIILCFVGYMAYSEGMTLKETLVFSSLIFLMFVSVLLHEYGHALMARHYGIRTVDIILSPIGGLARMERLPSEPKKELMVAFAGPLVNLVIAVLIYLLLRFIGIRELNPDTDMITMITHPIGYLALFALLNVVLFGFNLVPAFPMDGGRILRALLSLFLTRKLATRIAMVVGQALAIGFVIFGTLNQVWSLVLIGPVIFLMARREYAQVAARQS